jgi:hypothetical protein
MLTTTRRTTKFVDEPQNNIVPVEGSALSLVEGEAGIQTIKTRSMSVFFTAVLERR